MVGQRIAARLDSRWQRPLHGIPTALGSYGAMLKVQTVKLAGMPGYGEAFAFIEIRPLKFRRAAAQATAQVTLSLTVTAHYTDLSWTEPQGGVPAVGLLLPLNHRAGAVDTAERRPDYQDDFSGQ